MNKDIALLLTGQYPNEYLTPDMMRLVDCLQKINPDHFSDARINMFYSMAEDRYELVVNLLDKVQRDYPHQYFPLLKSLGVHSKYQVRKIEVTQCI
jgi:hypothetical protein